MSSSARHCNSYGRRLHSAHSQPARGQTLSRAQEGLHLASETVKQGSRSSLLGTLALAPVVGFIISRKR